LPPLYSAHVAAGELPDRKLRAPSIMPYLKQPGESLPTFIPPTDRRQERR
jgi:hypothetical protein